MRAHQFLAKSTKRILGGNLRHYPSVFELLTKVFIAPLFVLEINAIKGATLTSRLFVMEFELKQVTLIEMLFNNESSQIIHI